MEKKISGKGKIWEIFPRSQKLFRRQRKNLKQGRKCIIASEGMDAPDPESQATRRSDGYGGWCLELRRGSR